MRNTGNQVNAQHPINSTSPIGEQPQQDNQGTKQEPTVPEVFMSQKPGKAKMDE
jgi:hypothetical protein